MNFDVFNGDADGICALLQLRLAEPREAALITGVKRDIGLLKRVDAAAGDLVTVLDVSLDKNRQALLKILNSQVDVFYVDHHQASDIPEHPHLKTLINTDSNVCTSLLVDHSLDHRFTAWAVVAAFGDNLHDNAVQAAQRLALSDAELQQLRQLGIAINYNAYGESVDDLHIAPDALYQKLYGYPSPFEFIKANPQVCQQLFEGYENDMALAEQTLAEYQTEKVVVYILPDAKWARRVSGAWSNALANRHPARAHAVLTHNTAGGYVVSVRAPLDNKTGADDICAQFPGGGGRKAAAGINQLSSDALTAFIDVFSNRYVV